MKEKKYRLFFLCFNLGRFHFKFQSCPFLLKGEAQRKEMLGNIQSFLSRQRDLFSNTEEQEETTTETRRDIGYAIHSSNNRRCSDKMRNRKTYYKTKEDKEYKEASVLERENTRKLKKKNNYKEQNQMERRGRWRRTDKNQRSHQQEP